ncbi:MAG: hypothetical protein ACKVQU_22605 [Burkholderiales bacterium]
MSTLQSKPLRRIVRAAGTPLMCLFIATGLFVPTAGTAGVTAGESGEVTVVPAPDKVDKGQQYQIRCWQFGRLLFEENHVGLPPDWTRYTLKVQGKDRDANGLFVAETSNATCLIRAMGEKARPQYLP